jgi:hypothetical protein
MNYSEARAAVRAAVMAGGFSATQTDGLTAAIEQMLAAYFADRVVALETSIAATMGAPGK